MNTKTLLLTAFAISVLSTNTHAMHNDSQMVATKKSVRLAFFLKKDCKGNTLLHQAVSDYAQEAVYIICRAAHQEGVLESIITARNAQQATPLHIAVETNQIDLIRFMCTFAWRYGFLETLFTIKDINGNTVLTLAEELYERTLGYYKTMKLLIQYHELLEQLPVSISKL